MSPDSPLFDATFDRDNPADAERFSQLMKELAARIAGSGISHGVLLHRWLDSTHLKIVVYADTPEGRGAAQSLVDQGFALGSFLEKPESSELSDLVKRVQRATAQLDPESSD